jgi:hypothetical protein
MSSTHKVIKNNGYLVCFLIDVFGSQNQMNKACIATQVSGLPICYIQAFINSLS